MAKSENKIKPTDADVTAFLESVEPAKRREDGLAMLEIMRELTGEPGELWGHGMVGFGRYHYRYESGREGDWYVTGFAPRKGNLTVYIMDGFPRHAELMKKLGKYKTGKSCLYINKLEDVDLDVLKDLIQESAAYVKEIHAE